MQRTLTASHGIRDLALGLIAGADLVIWNSTLASLVFAGALAPYLASVTTRVLFGAAVVTLLVGLCSALDVHVTVVDEQTVAVLAAVAVAMNARFGEFASAGAAAATMMTIIALTTTLCGGALCLTLHLGSAVISRPLPYPVIAGFLAGLGWLLVSAGVTMLGATEQIVPGVVGGAILYIVVRRSPHTFALPALLAAFTAVFFAVVWMTGASMEALRGTWLFNANVAAAASPLDIGAINIAFIVSMLPHIGTIVLLSILGASINLSGLSTATGQSLAAKRELSIVGVANIASGLVMGAPAVSDVVSSVTYARAGARGRVFMVTLALCLFVAAFTGARFIEYAPKVVMGALVFFAALQFLHDWLVDACRALGRADATVVWLVFAAVIVVGPLTAIVLGCGVTWARSAAARHVAIHSQVIGEVA